METETIIIIITAILGTGGVAKILQVLFSKNAVKEWKEVSEGCKTDLDKEKALNSKLTEKNKELEETNTKQAITIQEKDGTIEAYQGLACKDTECDKRDFVIIKK